MISKLRSNKVLIFFYRLKLAFSPFFRFRIWSFLKNISWYIRDFSFYRIKSNNKKFTLNFWDNIICLNDKTINTPIEPIYFYQDTWAAEKIFTINPKTHYDVGSSVKSMALISKKIPVTIVDIRPIFLELNSLNFIKGNILDLPFADNSIECISSLCVVEHIGLGRYGDNLDSNGSEKSIEELQRVVFSKGFIVFSVPVDFCNKIYFNAHRAFTRQYVLELFNHCNLVEEKYIYGSRLINEYRPQDGFGTGLFLFQKK